MSGGKGRVVGEGVSESGPRYKTLVGGGGKR